MTDIDFFVRRLAEGVPHRLHIDATPTTAAPTTAAPRLRVGTSGGDEGVAVKAAVVLDIDISVIVDSEVGIKLVRQLVARPREHPGHVRGGEVRDVYLLLGGRAEQLPHRQRHRVTEHVHHVQQHLLEHGAGDLLPPVLSYSLLYIDDKLLAVRH